MCDGGRFGIGAAGSCAIPAINPRSRSTGADLSTGGRFR
jgi:hypothetical protein